MIESGGAVVQRRGADGHPTREGSGPHGIVTVSPSLAARAGLALVEVERRPALLVRAVSDTITALFGHRVGALLGPADALLELIHPDDRELYERGLEVSDGGLLTVRMRTADGRHRWTDHHLDPWSERDGVSVLIQDVNPRREAEHRAAMCEQWFRSLAHHAPVILFGVDASGRFTQFEYYVERGEIAGRFDVIGRRVAEIFDDLPEHLALLERALAGERVHERLTHRGSTFELHCEAVDLDDARGTTLLGSILNVTSQVRLDQALRENEQYLHTIIHTVTDGILLNDTAGRIKFVNSRLAKLLGVRPEDMIGKHIFDFMDAEGAEQARRNLARRREGHADRFDHRFLRADGTVMWSLVTAKPMYDAAGAHQGSLVAVTDISERKRAEEALRRARDELELRVRDRTIELKRANDRLKDEVKTRRLAEEAALHASRTKSVFLASMSHELRTPLNAIVGYDELLLEEIEASGEGEQYVDDLRRIHSSSLHLLNLINNVLDLSKIEASKMEVSAEQFSIADVARELEATIRPLALKNGNRALVTCDADQVVTTDRTKLKQILLNLLGNACKFTSQGEVRLRLSVVVRGVVVWLICVVSDTGVGIPREQQAQIFQAFTQTESGRRVEQGTGLGLTITKRLCEMLGGDITVDSAVGQGTTFTVCLPVGRASR